MKSNIRKKVVKKEISKKTAIQEKITYPSNKNWWCYSAAFLSFIFSFIIYIWTLAPGVTFEDSGELIAAAYGLGVPHQPGYPLFTMLGKIFSYLPIGNVAYRLNLMSAFFTSASVMLIFSAAVLMIEEVFIHTKFWKTANNSILNILKYAFAFLAAILFAVSAENWEQSVITEVYGLNNFFNALFIVLVLLWKRQENEGNRIKYFLFISLVLGLTITNHSTSFMLIPIFGIFILLVNWRILLNVRLLLKGALFFILGLTPFLYLPLASKRNPFMDWGNPENYTNFIRTITRSQYSFYEHQSFPKFFAEFGFYFNKLLVEQWFPLILIFAVLGLFILFRNNRKIFWFVLVFLIFSIPVVTYMTDFDIRGNSFVAKENGELVSVFYIPSYMIISILTAIGLFFLFSFLKTSKYVYYIIVFIVVTLSLLSPAMNFKKNDMSRYRFPQEYSDNLFKLAGKNAIVFYNWDPFGFPFFYYQYVEKKRTDLVVIDQMLLKRSWYISVLQNHYYNEIFLPSKNAFDNFLYAVAPFEAKEKYDGSFIEYNYINMINSIIDSAFAKGKEVYFTYVPQPNILRNYKLEPLFAAYKLHNKPPFISNYRFEDFKYAEFTNPRYSGDRMAGYIRDFYAELIISRANLFENMTLYYDANLLYKKALLFTRNNKQLTGHLHTKISEMKLKGIY